MNKRRLSFFCLLLVLTLTFAPLVKAEVPFPKQTSGSYTEETFSDFESDTFTDTNENLPTAEVTKTSLPMDPTLFAALIGLAGMALGCLMTLSGAFVISRLNKNSMRPRKTELEKEEDEVQLNQQA